jgi:TusA-related sulfurtransferase
MQTASSEPASDEFASNLQVCFEILLYLSSRLTRLKPGETLAYITSDPEAEDKIQSWCDERGYTLLESGPSEDGRQRFLIQK